MSVLFSIVESPSHPNFAEIYARLGLREYRFASIRKAVKGLQTLSPDYVVAEFFYGFGNNYAGANLGNLDVFLSSLQKYAPEAAVVVMVSLNQRKYADQLADKFPIAAILTHPVRTTDMEQALSAG